MDGNPLPIQQCLPPEDDARFRATLEELVQVDLEFQWKQPGRDSSQVPDADVTAAPPPGAFP